MKEYVMCNLTEGEYDGFLLCLTFDSVLSYLPNIEKEPVILNSNGLLLIDQLLVTGNGRNRFILFKFSHGKVDINSARNIVPDEYYKRLSIKLLQRNYDLLDNSILTDQQRNDVRQGIAF